MKHTYKLRALTFIELLVVIAIFGVLAAMLLPALIQARKKAEEANARSANTVASVEPLSLTDQRKLLRDKQSRRQEFPNLVADLEARGYTVCKLPAGFELVTSKQLGSDEIAIVGRRTENRDVWSADFELGSTEWPVKLAVAVPWGVFDEIAWNNTLSGVTYEVPEGHKITGIVGFDSYANPEFTTAPGRSEEWFYLTVNSAGELAYAAKIQPQSQN